MNLAQQFIVKSLANNPAFQQFAVRTANHAKTMEQRMMNLRQRAVGSSFGQRAAEEAPKRASASQQGAQRHREATQGTQGSNVFLHRARAFASALKDEVSKDFGGTRK